MLMNNSMDMDLSHAHKSPFIVVLLQSGPMLGDFWSSRLDLHLIQVSLHVPGHPGDGGVEGEAEEK